MDMLVGEKISVCLLTYNHVEVIESTLKSILNQTIAGYEIIVSDDCSTDGTWELILELAKKDERIKPVCTAQNIGMPSNANFAVAQSTRPYIALLHHDDIYRKDLLEKWANVLDRYTDVAFVFNSYSVCDSDFICEESIHKECIDGKWLLEQYLFPRFGCLIRGTAMIRRAMWERVGGMREQFGLLADVDMWMRFAMCWSVGYVNEPLIRVRNQRPSYYPEIYKKSSVFFWQRQRFIYDIHIANRLEYLNFNTFYGRFKWLRFRWQLSLETAKWLCYAVLRKKWSMLYKSHFASVQEELFYVRWLRILFIALAK